ncbi:LytTR family transcriptional regulator [Rhodobacteraceae bacterium M385]|nr:LytTR family transcriptional regulator [Rhodobacteraceae bacterium M385]
MGSFSGNTLSILEGLIGIDLHEYVHWNFNCQEPIIKMNSIGSGAPKHTQRDWIIRVGVASLASVLCALIGPFGTYADFSFSERLVYWGGLIMGLLIPVFFIRILVYRHISGPPWRADISAVACMSVTLGPIVWLFNIYVMGFRIAEPIMLFQHIAMMAMICSVPVCIRAYLRWSVRRIQSEQVAEVVSVPKLTVVQAAFLRRIDPNMRGEVWRVSADDHQVRVWTELGETKVRIRFSDALKELTEFEGARIHRSHWVAFNRIESVEQDGRRYVARLVGGSQLPVSQKGLETLQKVGVANLSDPDRAQHTA